MSSVIGTVGALHRYPVKSMRGEAVASVHLDRLGIEGDRRLAVRDLTTGKIVSAKRPALGVPLLACRATTEPDGTVMIDLGDSVVPAESCDAELSELLGRAVRMERASDADEVYESEWPEIEGLALSGITVDLPLSMSTEKGTFVDLAALHVLASSSLTTLASLAPGSHIDVARFRPSMVITTDSAAEGFVEDGWAERSASIGGASIAFTTAAPRCVMTTLAQPGLERDPRVLQAIAAHHRLEMGGFGYFACLGVYAEVTQPGEVRVGDEVVLH